MGDDVDDELADDEGMDDDDDDCGDSLAAAVDVDLAVSRNAVAPCCCLLASKRLVVAAELADVAFNSLLVEGK